MPPSSFENNDSNTTQPDTSPFNDIEVSPEIDELEEDGAEHRRYVLSRDAKGRLDVYLQNRVKGISRHQIQKLISLGGVSVNGKKPKQSQKLKQGDVVDIIMPLRGVSEIKGEDIPLDILYEDDALIVVNKQANLIVHPARSYRNGTLLNALVWHFEHHPVETQPTEATGALSAVGRGAARPGVVHRLDKNTTGVMVLAKQDEPHWHLARQFEEKTNLKVYLAVVHGCPAPPGGAVDQPIGKHPTIREAMAVRHDSTGRPSLTLYRVRERYKGYSLVEMELKTGRTHQIRVHFSYIGHPLVGDIIYGGMPVGLPELDTPPTPPAYRPHLNFARDKEEGTRVEQFAAQRNDIIMATPALHAALLRIKHPTENEHEMTFTAPLHSPMNQLVHQLRNQPAPGPVINEGTWLDLNHIITQ